MKRLSASTAVVLLFILYSVSLSAVGQEDTRKHHYKYLVPMGYVGWLQVDFNVKGAPALPVEDGYYVIKIPDTGHLQTSTSDGHGILGDYYFYYCGDTRKRLDSKKSRETCRVWGEVQSEGRDYEPAAEGLTTSRVFFVGTKEAYLKYEHTGNNPLLAVDEYGRVKPGYISILPCLGNQSN